MSNEELVRLIQEGVNVTENLGILYQQNEHTIKTICSRYMVFGAVGIDDLMQESFFGLKTASERYHGSNGSMFMTFAHPYIKYSCLKYIQRNHGSIHLPDWIMNKMKEYKSLDSSDPDEIMKALDLNKDQYNLLIQAVKMNWCIGIEETINTGRNGDDSFTISDTLSDDTDLEQEYIDCEIERLMSSIWYCLDDLNDDRKKTIMLLRYKLNLTQQEIADNMDISDSTVGYLEQQSLKKMRELDYIQMLADLNDYDCGFAYHGGLKTYKENGFVSPVELIAEKHIDLDKRLKAIQDGV